MICTRYLKHNSDKDLSWFFDDLLVTNKRIDYKLVRLKNQKLLIRNNGELVSPLLISGITGDSVFFEKWVDGFSGQKWIEIPKGDYSDIKIDPVHKTPEINRMNNNIRKSGIFPRTDPIEAQLYLLLEELGKTTH